MLKGKNHFPKMIFLFKLGTRPSCRTDLPLTSPGASQAVQMVLSCLPGASLVPRRLSNWFSCLPGASQAVPNGPLLPPWHLPGASQAVPNGPFLPPWCLPGASRAVQMVLSCSLVPPWCLPGCRKVLSCLVPPRCPNAFLQPPGCP